MNRPGRRQIGVAAWSLAGFTVLVLVAALVLVGLNAGRMAASKIGFYSILAVAVVVYAGTGRLVASRVPRNAIGWLLGLIGLSLAAAMFTEQYALYGLATVPRSLPAARLAGWLSGAAFVFTFALLFFLVLLFPDGRLPSRRWRPVLWAMFVVLAGWAAQLLQAGTTITGGMSNALVAAGVSYPNPLGVFPRHGWFSDALGAIFALGVVTAVLVVASVFARRRGASAELRQQLAWLGYVGLLTAVPVAVFLPYGLITNGNVNPLLGALFWGYLLIVPTIGVPLACAVAVLKYRLYDLDVVVKKTVVVGVVAAAFTGIYALVVVGVGAVTGGSGSSALTFAAAALAAVALAAGQGLGRAAGRPAGVRQAGDRRTRCCRSSRIGSPAPTPPRRSCPGWRGCWPRPPVPNAPRCGCAAAGRTGWRRPGRPRRELRRPPASAGRPRPGRRPHPGLRRAAPGRAARRAAGDLLAAASR